MSIRVTDPAGAVWDVSREWLSRPLWNSEASSNPPPDVGIPDLDLGDDIGGLAAIVLSILIALVFFLVLLFFWPLLSLLVALVLGGIALLARVAGVARWTVRAVSAEKTLEWRVRGVLRSRRIMHGVARALERGGPDELGVESTA